MKSALSKVNKGDTIHFKAPCPHLQSSTGHCLLFEMLNYSPKTIQQHSFLKKELCSCKPHWPQQAPLSAKRSRFLLASLSARYSHKGFMDDQRRRGFSHRFVAAQKKDETRLILCSDLPVIFLFSF